MHHHRILHSLLAIPEAAAEGKHLADVAGIAMAAAEEAARAAEPEALINDLNSRLKGRRQVKL